ncbi:MAG: chorismate-binding protein, partial [Methylotenera sp.]|nr:chorismate-binding protein [Methylotenera sp.]
MSLLQHQLTYHTDSARLFERIAHQPWAMFLDSGQLINFATGKPGSQYGRYDILVANPFITFSTQGALTTICEHGQSHVSTQDPFQLVNNALAQYQPEACIVNACDLPFTGGAVGYFGYDLARRLEKLASKSGDTIETRLDEIPQMQVGIYDWAVVVDHRHKTAHLVSHGFDHKTREQWAELCALLDTPHQVVQESLGFEVVSEVTSNMDKLTYETAFNAIQRYIHEGDCYQVNLAQRFSAKVRGNAWVAYQKLREISPAPFMAYMNLNAVQVISGSPERFLQVMDGCVETRPIKGTRPRSEDITQDFLYANELQTTINDIAEYLMIVD